MIPDCERRLITAWDELSKLVVCMFFCPRDVISRNNLPFSFTLNADDYMLNE